MQLPEPDSPYAPATDSKVSLTVKYDGPQVATGRMDARALAPAMLATAKLFERAATEMYGPAGTIKVEVVADFRRGSFAYDLIASAQPIVLLGTTLATNLSVSDIIESGKSLFHLVKFARGRKPVEVARQDGHATVGFQNNGTIENITVNIATLNMFSSSDARADAEATVEPLRLEGIESFQMSTLRGSPVEVQKGEVAYFEAQSQEDEVLKDDISEDIVEVLSPHFNPGNKWQFAFVGGGQSFWARIVDKQFLEKVHKGIETFGAGHTLRVRLRVLVTQHGDKHERSHEVIEVLEHFTPTQSDLFDPAA